MKKTISVLLAFLVITQLACLSGCRKNESPSIDTPVHRPSSEPASVISMAELTTMAEKGDVTVYAGEEDSVQAILGSFTDQTVSSDSDASAVIRQMADILSLDASTQGDLYHNELGEEGTAYAMNQQVNGLPVQGSEVILLAEPDGQVAGLYNYYNPELQNVDTNPDPSLDEESKVLALLPNLVQEQVGARLQELGVDFSAYFETLDSKTELIVYAPENEQPRLVWKLSVNPFFAAAENGTEEDEETELTEEDYEAMPGYEALPLLSSWYIYANGPEVGQVMLYAPDFSSFAGEITSEDNNGTKRTINVDQDGKDIYLYDTIRNIQIYSAEHSIKLGGPDLAYVETEYPGNPIKGRNTISKRAVTALYQFGRAYDYYKYVLGRTSYDDAGAKIDVSINYTNLAKNAYWHGGDKYFCLLSGKMENALDLIGHEFTHAVIQHTVGKDDEDTLTYSCQSGALNEAYADIMGNLIEDKSDRGRWILGEDLKKFKYDMSDPAAEDVAAHYRDYTGEKPHEDAGIFSHAAYLMMTDSRTADITNSTWAKVFYRSLPSLSTEASFVSARIAITGSALRLGFTKDQMQAIYDAFDAVGIEARKLGDPEKKISALLLATMPFEKIKQLPWTEFNFYDNFDQPGVWYCQAQNGELYVSFTFLGETEDPAACPSEIRIEGTKGGTTAVPITPTVTTGMTYGTLKDAELLPPLEPAPFGGSEVPATMSSFCPNFDVRVLVTLYFQGDDDNAILTSALIQTLE